MELNEDIEFKLKQMPKLHDDDVTIKLSLENIKDQIYLSYARGYNNGYEVGYNDARKYYNSSVKNIANNDAAIVLEVGNVVSFSIDTDSHNNIDIEGIVIAIDHNDDIPKYKIMYRYDDIIYTEYKWGEELTFVKDEALTEDLSSIIYGDRYYI